MIIKLYRNSSEINAVNKNISEMSPEGGIVGTLREATTIIDPSMLVTDVDSYIGDVNYAYIQEFNRYYFIKNIDSVRDNLWRIDMHVDVLYTYRDSIRNNSAIIERNQNYYDLLLNDGLFQTQQEPRIWQVSFPGGFTRTDFVLAVAGN